MSKPIIITGDDYGLCASVNQAIEECMAAGSMSATCVMTNMALYADAARLRRKFPNRSIGIHWNITQGRPVLSPEQVPTLVDERGMFAPDLRRRWFRRQVNGAEIRAELAAQYDRFRAVAGAADFWNTHQNVHVFPGLFQLFVDAAEQLKIAAMRSHRRFTVPKNGSVARYLMTHPNYWLKGRLIARWSAAAAASGMRMPDGRVYLPGHKPEMALLGEFAERLPWKKIHHGIEWVVHPATSGEDKLLGALTESRRREYELLSAPGLAAQINKLGLRLVDFKFSPGECAGRGGKAA